MKGTSRTDLTCCNPIRAFRKSDGLPRQLFCGGSKFDGCARQRNNSSTGQETAADTANVAGENDTLYTSDCGTSAVIRRCSPLCRTRFRAPEEVARPLSQLLRRLPPDQDPGCTTAGRTSRPAHYGLCLEMNLLRRLWERMSNFSSATRGLTHRRERSTPQKDQERKPRKI